MIITSSEDANRIFLWLRGLDKLAAKANSEADKHRLKLQIKALRREMAAAA